MKEVRKFKKQAIQALESLRPKLELATYEAILEGLTDIEMLRDRDSALEEMWAQLEDVSFDPDTECILEPFMGWGAGVHREEIWHWFDRRYSKGVAYLLYSDGYDRTEEIAHLYHLKQSCKECGSLDCGFNKDGICRYAMVNDHAPEINDKDGCKGYLYIRDIQE